MTVETIDKRFCTVAVGKGFITLFQLMEALEIQAAEDLVGKKHRLIGRILYDLGLLTLSQIERILGSMSSYDVSVHGQSDDTDNE